MARQTRKKPAKATGGKQAKAYAAPRIAPALGSPDTPPSPGTSLPAVVPPLSPVDLNPAQLAELNLITRQRKEVYWKGMPKGSKLKSRVAAIVSMKVEGLSTDEIAEKLNLKPASIRQYMWLAGKQGLLSTADPHDLAEHKLVHRVVSNLDEWLTARNAVTGLPDKEVTLEAAKGFGIFKDQKNQEPVQNQQANVLSINFQFPPSPGPLPSVRVENVGGSPAYVDGKIIDSESGS